MITGKKCTFAFAMRARFRQVTAWVLLLAFCSMIGTKALHHHHGSAVEDIVCPIDGIEMSHHALSHTVLQGLDDDDDSHCFICHFTITKVIIPTCLRISTTDQYLFPHIFSIFPCVVCNIQGVSLLRAPPMN